MDRLFSLNTATVVVSGAAVIASTFFKHFFTPSNAKDGHRREFLFDEAFHVMRMFFKKSALHTVEDLQKFGNNFVPAPFWVRIVRIVVPLPTRLEAGRILISTLGEEEIHSVVGGREWWQRTAQKEGGVTGEWISMKRDWQGLPPGHGDEEEEGLGNEKHREEAIKKMKDDAKKRNKNVRRAGAEAEEDRAKDERRRKRAGPLEEPYASAVQDGEDVATTPELVESDSEDETGSTAPQSTVGDDEEYSAEMDEMRCLYYLHGGGYFFGSINTHRYSIWRYARKMGGRAFAINYRLAPQYPFPCALADALSGYLYLIRPPPGAKHKPVDPAKLTIAGDSAGGGLTLALLCLLRDSGLPLPAGACLISPWCDLTHSFPSILENTDTDIVPAYGWLFQPSTLWPPPPPEFQERANRSTSLTEIQRLAAAKASQQSSQSSSFLSPSRYTERKGDELAAKVAGANFGVAAGREGKEGSDPHAGDPKDAEGSTSKSGGGAKAEVGEVLRVEVDGKQVEVRDQIQLYATNEQLAHPFVSPIWQPSLGGLPPLFVIAGDSEVLRDEIVYMAHRAANPEKYPVRKALQDKNPERTAKHKLYPPTKVHLQVYDNVCHDLPLLSFTTPAKYCYRAIASFLKFVTADEAEIQAASAATVSSDPYAAFDSPFPDSGTATLSEPLDPPPTLKKRGLRNGSFIRDPKPKVTPDLDETIYSSTQPFNRPPFVDNMVRERVSMNGVVRDMEPVSEVKILHLDPEDIGLVKEAPIKRYLAGKSLWDKRFKRKYEYVQKRREHHLKKSIAEEAGRMKKRISDVKQKVKRRGSGFTGEDNVEDTVTDVPARSNSPEPLSVDYQGIWELHGETPPPSSIAARKDTMEARKLASFLDTHYSKLNALHLWSDAHDVAAVPSRPPAREASEDVEKLN